jgi:mannose-6-phosphate isomerase-like protein (cupin superfamily)
MMSEQTVVPYKVMSSAQFRDMVDTNAEFALFHPDLTRYWANVVNKDHAETLIAEIHEHEADVYLVVEGEGDLYLGGDLLNVTIPAPGQQRGTGIVGATRFALRPGDVAFIPEGTPHMLDVRVSRLTYLVIKVDLSAGESS